MRPHPLQCVLCLWPEIPTVLVILCRGRCAPNVAVLSALLSQPTPMRDVYNSALADSEVVDLNECKPALEIFACRRVN